MRLWHYKMLEYLPDLQFRGQLRELVAILRDWQTNGKTNHLLINQLMNYSKEEFVAYFMEYRRVYNMRYNKDIDNKYVKEFVSFLSGEDVNKTIFTHINLFHGWHTNYYLKMCYANLAEKHFYGLGKSRITDDEWQKLLDGYKIITGKDYEL